MSSIFHLCDAVTSWRHVMTSLNLIYLSQLVDVLESWFFFVSMIFQVTEFKDVLVFPFVWCRDVMTSCHDVTKLDSPISACRCARKLILFCFHVFRSLSSKILMIFLFLLSWRHDVMSWRHKNCLTDLRFWIRWKDDPVQNSMIFLVVFSRNVSVHVFVGWHHVITSRHDVSPILSITLQPTAQLLIL